MGICKCPKRKVTNQFCFEHRVNVCEDCMVTNHPRCIVQSYLQWLQDSDYNPVCDICMFELKKEDCIRLSCYHVFHWACIDDMGQKIPNTTAPSGYTCPTCKVELFPPPHLVSPVAEALKQKLASVNWARAGLGLPLLIEHNKPLQENRKIPVSDNSQSTSHYIKEINQNPTNSTNADDNPHLVVHVEDSSTLSRTENQLPKRIFQDFNDSKDILYDHDENKYRRKTALELWWKSFWRPIPRGRLYYHQYCMRIIFLVVTLTMVFLLFSWLGQIVTRDDPSFDVHNNPNIRVANVKET
ncbi:zfpl1, putative [Pediculus humanus corporis]|uniref:Zinc finger protein-like 1 homolog n=1 Tax=Pediculus humanus subsp. corporis TaxID=121224 RepID=E0V933_PEDHC|nr:zfpl1, putative [Pediculus humanus corporis]EEB09889.1 zfpl1, putative [Pediculus humanus corporis]